MRREFKFKTGDKVVVDFPGDRFHGQTFEIVSYNDRHQFAIVRATKRFDDYRKGDDLRFTGTLLSSLVVAP